MVSRAFVHLWCTWLGEHLRETRVCEEVVTSDLVGGVKSGAAGSTYSDVMSIGMCICSDFDIMN